MSALSLSQIETSLSMYAPADGTFLPRLNQVLARLHNMGTYRDLTVQYSLVVLNNRIVLPDDADAILHAIVGGTPSAVRSLWHDFKQVGTTNNDLTWGLVDAGFGPTKFTLDADTTTDTFEIVPAAESITQTAFDVALGGAITMAASSETQRHSVSTDDPGFSGTQLVFPEDVLLFDTIRFVDLVDRYDIRTTLADPDTTIATVGPGTGIARYRVFRTPLVENGTVVNLLCKRAFRVLSQPEDITYLGNINAIKNGFFAVLAEDAHDTERAEYYWSKAYQSLEEEASSTRGAASPRLSLDPHGTEGKWGVPNML